MYMVNKAASSEIKRKGSAFLGYLFTVSGPHHFNLIFDFHKKQHPKATHYCRAYRLFDEKVREFSSDDGEPSGTAGLPLLNALRSAELIQTGVIVVRYYGGTKLGTSGLIKAYQSAVETCIQQAGCTAVTEAICYHITYTYEQEPAIKQLFNHYSLHEQQAVYTEKVSKIVLCPSSEKESFEIDLKRLKHYNIQAEKQDATTFMPK